MRRFLFLAPLLALGGCGLPGLVPPAANSAPVQQAACSFDNYLETTWKVFNLSLDLLNELGDAGKITPGTPEGKAVAAGIRTVNAALGRAERFAVTCNEREIKAALADAESGIADLSAATKGSN